jgi:hypothetical protein
MTKPARFTQADIARVVRAAGSRIIEIAPDGLIRILPAPQPAEQTQDAEPEPVAPQREIVL